MLTSNLPATESAETSLFGRPPKVQFICQSSDPDHGIGFDPGFGYYNITGIEDQDSAFGAVLTERIGRKNRKCMMQINGVG
jgi:hypothetical protein